MSLKSPMVRHACSYLNNLVSTYSSATTAVKTSSGLILQNKLVQLCTLVVVQRRLSREINYALSCKDLLSCIIFNFFVRALEICKYPWFGQDNKIIFHYTYGQSADMSNIGCSLVDQ